MHEEKKSPYSKLTNVDLDATVKNGLRNLRNNFYKLQNRIAMGGRKMVLYHAYHAGTLCRVMIHRLTETRSKQAVLLVGCRGLMGDIYDRLDEFVKAGFFEKVLYCNECFGLYEPTEDACEHAILQHFDQVFENAGYGIQDFEQIYTGVDTLHSFGIYLSLKNKPYFFMETIRDFFMIAQERVDRLPPEMQLYGRVMTKHGASNGVGELVTRIVYPGSAYRKEENERVLEFDFHAHLLSMDPSVRERLYQIYGLPDNIPENVPITLIITCSQWSLRNEKDVKRQAGLMYQYMADYYIPSTDTIVVKPHPLSRFKTQDFRQYFNVPTFSECFPSNYISTMSELNITKTYTTTSSGHIESLKSEKDAHSLGMTFVHSYKLTPLMHYCLSLYLNVLSECELYTYGINNDFVKNMLSYSFGSDHSFNWLNTSDLQDGTFAIIDNIDWNPGNYKAKLIESIKYHYGDYTLCFINSKKDAFFLDELTEEEHDNFVCVKLERTKVKAQVLDSLVNQYIYIYSTNKSTRERIKQFVYQKENHYSGVNISATALDENETSTRILRHEMLKSVRRCSEIYSQT